MKTRDAIRLARTKLKSHPVMRMVMVISSSLLFAVLVFGVTVFSGLEKSSEEIINSVNDGKYLVKTHPLNTDVFLSDSDIDTVEEVKAAREFEQNFFENLRQKYQNLGLKYDIKNEISLLQPDTFKSENKNLPKELQVRFNRQSPAFLAYQKKKTEELRSKHKNKLEDLRVLGEKYGASGDYELYYAKIRGLKNMRLIKSGKEEFGEKEDQGLVLRAERLKHGVRNGEYMFVDEELLGKNLMKKNPEELEGIPVIITLQEAMNLFGEKEGAFSKEPEEAVEKLRWYEEIKEKLLGKTYEVCYRNEVEQRMLEKLESDFLEMKLNEGVKDYRPPKLQYGYPEKACGEILVKQDLRNEEERRIENEQKTILKKLGEEVKPRHEKWKFQVVGFINSHDEIGKIGGMEDYIRSLFKVNNYDAVVIPTRLYRGLKEELKAKDLDWSEKESLEYSQRVLEFREIKQAKSFLEEGVKKDLATTGEEEAFEFQGEIFGVNYLAILEIREVFSEIMKKALPVVLILAMAMMGFMVIKVMTESRKEMAVYRAVGAKRIDILKIYLIYVLMLAIRVAILAIILGVLAAKTVDLVYGANLNNLMREMMGMGVEGVKSLCLKFLE